MAYTKTGANTWVAQAYADGGDVGGTAGTPVQIGANATLTFNSSGAIETANQAGAVITATPAWAGGAAAGSIAINLGSYTQFAAASQSSAVTEDGQGVGAISSYEISKDGKLSAVLDSGSRQLIGTIPLADFTNVDGLNRAGSNSYTEGGTSGNRTLNVAGTSGLGEITRWFVRTLDR